MKEPKLHHPGAGVVPADDEPALPLYDSARDYLAAVCRGTEKPHAARIAAARALLAYESPRLQGPLVSGSNVELADKAARSRATAADKEWAEKAAAVRAKHKREPK